MMHCMTRGPGLVLATLAVVAGMAACSSAAPAANEITLLGYQTGGFREQYTKAVIEPFEQAHPGVRVTYYGVRNSATELAVLRGHKGQDSPPPADVTIIDLSVAKIASDEGLLEGIRLDRVPNAQTLHALGAELGALGLPVTYDTLALIYDTRVVSPAPTSWTALWIRRTRAAWSSRPRAAATSRPSRSPSSPTGWPATTTTPGTSCRASNA